MNFYYIIIKVGNNYFAAIQIKDEFDLRAKSENIMDHIMNGNVVLICDDLETAAELFQIPVSDIDVDLIE